ncbi:family S53 protease-like protein [Mycena sp. CBHHK59/15]|nr:family S53 protease-like protein [Mycena sp. CBHHK59/15]
MTVHETRDEPARGFVDSGLAPAANNITLRIALKQNNMAGLQAALYAVSDPASALYGQHLTQEEVAAFVKPTDTTLSAVTQWLSENSIPLKPVTPAGDMLEITVPVAKANDLLSTQFSTFTHVETGVTSIRTLEYSIPTALQAHVDFFHPTTSFTRPLTSGAKFTAIKRGAAPTAHINIARDVPASCGSTITPACLQALYNIPTTPATQSSNILGVAGFGSQFANFADLSDFLTNNRPDMNSSTTFTVQSVDNGVNQQIRSHAGDEADLDIQYTVGIATGVPVSFITVGLNNHDGLDGFMDIVNALTSGPNGTRPNVFSTSYGFDETDMTPALTNNLCNAYMQLGALGGVSGGHSKNCTTFIPTFPSNCPYVTSVGATGGVPETAALFSSGGFSNYFGVPDYQSADVATYVTGLESTYSGLFNATGRGFPDVSAQGVNFEYNDTANGTSASTPLFASMIALLNDELITAGKSPLGFLNPFLYSATGRAALNDITTGNNPGCNTDGFSATAGWDPVTGLGTPDYAKLKTAVGL